MGLSLDAMKDTFMLESTEKSKELLNYLRDELNIDAGAYDYLYKRVICVDPNRYEEALKKGKEFAFRQRYLDLNWLDYQNVIRPGFSSDIAYGFLPNHRIIGEETYDLSKRYYWYDDEDTPSYLVEYLKEMKEYLKVESLLRKYNTTENALLISPIDIDYEEQMALMKAFILKYGYGPFEVINPLTFTGKLVKEPFEIKTR